MFNIPESVYETIHSARARWPSLHRLFHRQPVGVWIELTNDCNLKCKMCWRGKHRAVGYMDFDLFRRVVDEAAQIGHVSLALFFGGEATLHPRFAEMVEYAMSRRSRLHEVTLTTNGMLLDKRKSELLVRLGVDAVAFSLDGIGGVTESIRLGSVYEIVERNILDLLEIRGNRSKPKVITNTTITVQSDSELLEIYHRWHGKVDVTQFQGCLDENFRILNWSRWYKWSGHKLPKFCTMPFYYMYVLWNGDVTYCCYDISGEGYDGNLYDNSLMDIWRGNRLAAIRQGISCGKKVGLCRKCKFNN